MTRKPPSGPVYGYGPIAAACLTALFAFAACDRTETPPTPAATVPEGRDAYIREVLALKASQPDPAAYDAAISALQARHGYRPSTMPPLPATDADPGSAGSPAQPGAVRKTSAVDRIYVVRRGGYGPSLAATAYVSVPKGGTLEAFTTHEGIADPVLLAFRSTTSAAGSTHSPVAIVAYSDDAEGLDSRISWKNTTFSAKTVTLVVAAYDANSLGFATLHYRINGGAPKTIGCDVGAHLIRAYKRPFLTVNCSGPTSSSVGLQIEGDRRAEYAVLGGDLASMSGAYVAFEPGAVPTPSPLSSSESGFLLPFNPYDGSWHFLEVYPYSAVQLDTFACPE